MSRVSSGIRHSCFDVRTHYRPPPAPSCVLPELIRIAATAAKTFAQHLHRYVETNAKVVGELLHGKESRVYGDQAYRGQTAVIREHAPDAKDFTNQRYRDRGGVDEVERGKSRTKSGIRAKVEHSIGVIKRVFGFAKVRYRRLATNTQRLRVSCGLANLFIVRRRLLRT